MALEADLGLLGQLVLELGDALISMTHQRASLAGAYTAPLLPALAGAMERLLGALESDLDRRILAPGIVRELYYHVLLGEQGDRFQALALRDSGSHRVARVVRFLEHNFDRPLDIATIAKTSGMGESTLHHTFKAVTAMSPMQYLKKIRLHRGRVMMLSEGLNAGETAHRIGYGSPSQFSREFKRLFGVSPSQAAVT